MKRVMLLTALLGLLAAASPAQNIVLGERVPDLRSAVWLGGRQPAAAPFTYVEFYHTSLRGGEASLANLEALARKLGTKLRVVVVTREKKEEIEGALAPLLRRSDRFGVVLDGARYFASYGVSYLPFGVLTDAKNRALWMGNTLTLTEEIIDNSTE